MANGNIYEKNVNSFMTIANNRKEIIKYIDNAQASHISFDGNVLGIEKDNRLWLLKSQYNSVLCAETFASQFDDMDEEAVIIILGFGDGSYIRNVLLRKPNNWVIVFEPDAGLMKTVMSTVDISDVLSNKRLAFSVGDVSIAILKEYFMVLLKYSNMTNSRLIALPNYKELYSEYYKMLYSEYIGRCQSVVIERNTRVTLGPEAVANCISTIKDGIEQYSIDGVREAFAGVIDENSTAILVAAGPSLDKNIDELKAVRGRAFVMAVDTALKALLRKGIVPDMTITVDSHKHRVLFEHEGFADIPMVVCQSSNYKIYDLHNAKRFYYSNHEDLLDYVYEKCGKKISALESGGSVANSAFSMLVHMGFKNIALVGQDLAYPDKKLHSKEAYDGKEKGIEEVDDKKYFYVDGIDGNPILTEHNMDEYRRWFESYIVRHSDINVTDATEGGALIHGTKICTLKEVVDSLGAATFVDTQSLIYSIKPAFEDATKAMEVLGNISKEIAERQTKLSEGIVSYDKLIKLATNHKLQSSEAMRLCDVINKLNQMCESDKLLRFVTKYDAKSFYEIEDNKDISTGRESEYTMIRKRMDVDKARYAVYKNCLNEFEKDMMKL